MHLPHHSQSWRAALRDRCCHRDILCLPRVWHRIRIRLEDDGSSGNSTQRDQSIQLNRGEGHFQSELREVRAEKRSVTDSFCRTLIRVASVQAWPAAMSKALLCPLNQIASLWERFFAVGRRLEHELGPVWHSRPGCAQSSSHMAAHALFFRRAPCGCVAKPYTRKLFFLFPVRGRVFMRAAAPANTMADQGKTRTAEGGCATQS